MSTSRIVPPISPSSAASSTTTSGMREAIALRSRRRPGLVGLLTRADDDVDDGGRIAEVLQDERGLMVDDEREHVLADDVDDLEVLDDRLGDRRLHGGELGEERGGDR